MISIDDFIKSKKNLSASTLRIYNNILSEFVLFLNKNGIINIEDISKQVFLKYINEKTDSLQSIYTKKIIINTVKQFIAFLYQQKGLEFLYDNFKTIKIRTPEVSPNYYAEKTIEKILKTAKLILKEKNKDVLKYPNSKEKQRSFFIALRNMLILKLLVYCGLKGEEIREVRLCDILLDGERYAYVVVKRRHRKERKIPLGYTIINAEVKKFKEISKSEYVCSTFEGNKLSRRDLERTIEKIFIAAKINFIGTQGFKHSYAKKLVEKKYSIERMRYLLGYKNSATVYAYKKIFEKE